MQTSLIQRASCGAAGYKGGGDICPTITSQSMGICKVEKGEKRVESGLQKVGQVSVEGSQGGSVYSEDGNMPTLTHGPHGDANPKIYTKYRIRKLTPRECWRLMGFTDEDYDKAEKVNSNTQLYKQAGNSIVVPVLEAIFKQMLPENFFAPDVQSTEQTAHEWQQIMKSKTNRKEKS